MHGFGVLERPFSWMLSSFVKFERSVALGGSGVI